MKNNVKVTELKDYTEKMWFLGTDILEEKDLTLMEDRIGTSFERPEGAIYHVGVLQEFPNHYKNLEYSHRFQEILQEAYRRNYVWVFFDCDIES